MTQNAFVVEIKEVDNCFIVNKTWVNQADMQLELARFPIYAHALAYKLGYLDAYTTYIN